MPQSWIGGGRGDARSGVTRGGACCMRWRRAVVPCRPEGVDV